jgi:hypothetical protein
MGNKEGVEKDKIEEEIQRQDVMPCRIHCCHLYTSLLITLHVTPQGHHPIFLRVSPQVRGCSALLRVSEVRPSFDIDVRLGGLCL